MKDAFPRNRSTVRILDAGAGRGSTASYLRSLGYNNIDALTVSKERLDRAERSGLYRNFLFTALKAESTLYATGAFDAVICADGVFPDEVDPDAMDEMLRLVKPGSVFFLLQSFDLKNLELSQSVKVFPSLKKFNLTIISKVHTFYIHLSIPEFQFDALHGSSCFKFSKR